MVSTQESSRPVRRLQPQMATARIVERQDLTDDLWLIKLEPSIPFPFKPGQYCTIGAEDIERPYSIVSAPEEPLLELFVELVPPPDGALTPLMWQLKVGDSMSIRPRAKGIFTMDEGYHHHLMLATVTGIAPFVSTLRNYIRLGSQGHKFYVIQGASYHDEFTYREELEGMARSYPDTIVYVPTVSRPREEKNAVWEGVTGRANALIEEYVDKYGLSPTGTLVYACGHPGMIEDVRAKLEPLGFNVKEERYWKQ